MLNFHFAPYAHEITNMRLTKSKAKSSWKLIREWFSRTINNYDVQDYGFMFLIVVVLPSVVFGFSNWMGWK